MKSRRLRSVVGTNGESRRRRQTTTRRGTLAIERLEDRRLLAQYDTFGTFLGGALVHLQSDAVADHATQAALPVIGSVLNQAAKADSILPSAPNTKDLDTEAQLTTALKNAFGPNTTVDFGGDASGNTVHLVTSRETTLAVPKLETALGVLEFSTSQPITAHLKYNLDVTIVRDAKTGEYHLNTNATNKELGLDVSVTRADVPTFDGALGPLYVRATPVGAASASFLAAHYSVDVTGGNLDNTKAYAATSTVGGSANLALVLEGHLQPLAATSFNPKVTSEFHLTWAFGDAQGHDQTTNTATLGQAPKIEFKDVTLDLGDVVKNLGGSALNTVIEKAQPVFALAEKLDAKIPVLGDLVDQIHGLIGNNASTGVDVIDAFLKDPTVLGLIDAAADIPAVGRTVDPAVLHQFAATVREVAKVGKFLDAIRGAGGLSIDFGSYTFGGSSDLRTAGMDSLVDVDSTQTAPGTPVGKQGPGGTDPAQYLFDHYHLKSDLLSDPYAPIKLLLGSPSVSLLEYQDKIEAAPQSDVVLFNENFVVGIVPANFQVNLTIPKVDFNIDVGFLSKGLQGGPVSSGIYVVGGAKRPDGTIDPAGDPLFNAGLSLNFDFGIGTDLGAVALRSGVRASLVVAGAVDFAGTGRLTLDQIGGDCPLVGQFTLSGQVVLFADSSLNLDPKALAESLKNVVELAITSNPYVIAAKAFINNPTVVKFMEDKLGVSAADIKNIQDLVNSDHPLDAIAEGFKTLKVPTSQDFKDKINAAKKKAQQARDDALHANPTIGHWSDEATNIADRSGVTSVVNAATGGLFLIGGTSTTPPLVNLIILEWDHAKGCRAVDHGGSATANVTPTDFTPELGSLVNGVLTLYIGELADKRNFDEGKGEPDESVTVRPADPAHPSNGSVVVTLFGYSRQYDGVKKVVADGGDGNDVIDLAGTGVTASLSGGAGKDKLIAGLGAAYLDGGDDNDTLTGGAANDTLFGEAGDDSLTGGAGNDALYGGAGNDTLNGDFAEGSPADDSTDPAMSGDDTLYGDAGDDRAYGGPGNDVIDGGDGDDALRGGKGNDRITGDYGDDNLNGGADDDTLDGGAGTDRIYGSTGNDELIAGASTDGTNDRLYGDAGNDTLLGTGGDNILDGSDDDDRIYGFDGIDFLDGGQGADYLSAGTGNDILVGGTENDTLDGGAGSDTVYYAGGDGSDVCEGGDGQDVLSFAATLESNSGFEVLPDGTRIDLVLNAVYGVSAADFERLDLVTGGGTDTFHVGNLTGTAAALVQIYLSDAAASTITADGTSGDDSILVSALGANAQAIAGTPVPIQIRNSHATPVGGDTLTVRGLAGNDTLLAQAGAQDDLALVLDGGDGNDTLSADATLLGGAGNDTLIPLAGANNVDGGDGFDEILVAGSSANDIISVTGPATNLVITQGSGGASASSVNTVTAVEQIRVLGLDGADQITISGVNIATVVDAGAGNDVVDSSAVTAVSVTLLGGDGDDLLTAGAQADRVEGGTGNDSINGGPGSDRLLGGDGSDTFVWNNGDGSDQIDGGEDSDTILVNGSPTEGNAFTLAANGPRVNLSRTNLGTFTLDLGDIERIDAQGGIGADTFDVADLTGTPVAFLNLDLGAGDSAQDIVTMHGRNTADAIAIGLTGARVTIDGLSYTGSIANAGRAEDVLVIRGEDGNDLIQAAPAVNSQIGVLLDGGDGDDTLVGDATLLGGLGDDSLTGGAADDTLIGGAGNDTLNGGDGNDLLLGDAGGTGAGASFAIVVGTGSAGNDVIDGGAGNDTINGADGSDTLAGGAGDDVIGPVVTHVGAAVAFAEAGDDVIDGGSGNDQIDGGTGNDTIHGGSGADLLLGHAGADVIDGDDGDDTIDGGDGEDTLHGGAGNDVMQGSAGTDTIDGDSGNDTIDGGADNDAIHGGDGNDTIHGGTGADAIWGGSGADIIDGDDGNDALAGDDGNDTIRGGSGNDTSSGGAGDDLIGGNSGNDVITGDAGSDTLLGGAGDDYILGGTEADILLGDGDLDVLGRVVSILVGQGRDTLDGGAGNDTINGDRGNDLLFGRAGDDLLGPTVVNGVAFGEDGDDTLSGGDGNDKLDAASGNDLLFGDAGNDIIEGGSGNDTIHGGDGNDALFGSAGNDAVGGDGGNDSIDGGDGNDTLAGGAGDDLIIGRADNDLMFGDAGNDLLQGEAGNDVINGGDGADTILGGDGDDNLTGNAGDDVILGQFGNDTINGNEGRDQLWGGDGNDAVDGGADDDLVIGGAGNDSLLGSAGQDLLLGEAGNDTMLGGFGNDSLYGGEGDDVLFGGDGVPPTVAHVDTPSAPDDGDDVLSGGMGSDTLDAGNGNNILDAGDDQIAEVGLAGDGNDIAYAHCIRRNGARDNFGLHGGTNRVYVSGGLTDPLVPAESASRVSVTVTVARPSGQFVYQPGNPNQRHSDPISRAFAHPLPMTVQLQRATIAGPAAAFAGRASRVNGLSPQALTGIRRASRVEPGRAQ